MVYVALLRGINVGGKNKVNMSRLVLALESQGFRSVSTYINSGNIFFIDNKLSQAQLAQKINSSIKAEFDLDIKVLIRDLPTIKKVVNHIPEHWKNDQETKCDVMFLWDEYVDESVLESITIKPEIDKVRFVEGSLLWQVNRKNLNKSGMKKLPGTVLYSNITIRNCNTARKILERMERLSDD